MKKIIFIISLLLVTVKGFGQDSKTKFGIKGGLNYANIVDNNDEDISADYSGKIGFHIGGFVSFNINEKIAIRPELLFSQQGSNFSINGSNISIFGPDTTFITSIDGEVKESLILLPIIFEYKLSDKFDLGVGPQFSYSLKRDIEFENNPFDSGFIRNDDSEKFEIGIDLELGYTFSDSYRIGLRYNYGITERQNVHSSVIQLGISYAF